jgi:TonB family protein
MLFCSIACALLFAANAPAPGQEKGGTAKESQGEKAVSGEEASEADDTILASQDVDEPARIISNPPPKLPFGPGGAQSKCWWGIMRLKVVLLAAGKVGDVEVVASSADELNEKAIEAARRIEFVPARKGNRPVSVRVIVEHNFSAPAGIVYADRFMKIYYPEGCPNYSAISKDMRICFNSEKEARQAGYKKAKSKCP